MSFCLKVSIRKKIIFITLLLINFKCFATKITFIVPGKSNEDFWVTSAEFTRVAAINYGFEYEVLYAERDREYMVELAKQVASRKEKPDFVLIVNEKQSAPQMLKVLDKNKIKTFIVHVDLTEDQKNILKYPREKYKYWLGTIVADNVTAGYQIISELYKHIKENFKNRETFNLIAINGDKTTRTSIDREAGLNLFLKEHKNVQLLQILEAEWDREIAYQKMNYMFKRYDNIDLIWAANDPIALGALKSAQNYAKDPGKKLFIGGLNWSKESLEEIKKGNIITSLGGHFINGACALTIIYDYLHGIDINSEKFEVKLDLFSPIVKNDEDEYLKYLNKSSWQKINFNKYSKFLNHKLKQYDFNPKKLLKDIK